MKTIAMIVIIGTLITTSLPKKTKNSELKIEDFGARGDGQTFENIGSITSGSNSLEVSKPIFNSKDIGKLITVKGAGSTGKYLVLSTIIIGIKSPTNVLLSIKAKNTVKNAAASFGTDNTPALLKFNEFAKTNDKLVVLNFSKGKKYMLKSSRWTFNIINLQVNGNGCELRNVATNVWDRTSLTTCANMKVEKKDGDLPGTAPFYLISTANKGSSELHLEETNDCSNLSIGEWIAVCSDLISYKGFPPNFRYFEYAKIVALNTLTGMVKINKPLKYKHRSDAIWSRTLDKRIKFTGRASIIRLEEGSKFGITHQYNNINFICETQDNTDPVRADGYSITFNRCRFGNFVPSVAENVVTNYCSQRAQGNEFDKLVTNFTDNGSTWGTLSGGSSILKAVFNNSKLSNIIGFSCRNLVLNNCTKTGDSNKINFTIGEREGGTDTLLINGGFFNQSPSYPVLNNQVRKITLGINGVLYKDGVLKIPTTSDFGNFLTVIKEEKRIEVIGNSEMIATPLNNYGYIKSISSDGTNTNVIVKFKNKILGNETLYIANEPKHVLITNTSFAGKLVKKREYIKLSTSLLLEDISISTKYQKTIIMVGGALKKLIINVKKPYTGDSENAFLIFTGAYPDSTLNQEIIIDLKKKGRREINEVENTGRLSSDQIPNSFKISNSYYKSSYQFKINRPISGDSSDLPIIDAYIENCELK